MKVRHIIALLVVALLALSCAKERVETGGTAGAIAFTARLSGVATRGSVVETPAALADEGGFNVWAYRYQGTWTAPTSTKRALMNGATVSGTTTTDGTTTTTSWSYGTPIEWPRDYRLSFFAYGPAGGATVATAASDGTPQVSFTVDSDAADQTDFLVAKPLMDRSWTQYPSGDPVNIVFEHALSRISFSGLKSTSGDTREITVKEITLNGLYGSGTTPLTYPADWTLSGTANQNYTVSVADGTLDDTPFNNSGVPLTTSSGHLFLMPQTLANRAEGDPTMDVTLMVQGKEVKYTSLVFSPEAWEAGRSYDYQLVVSGNDLQIIWIDSDIELVDFGSSIALNALFLTHDQDEDVKRLTFAMRGLNTMNGMEIYDPYIWYGINAVNGVRHNIEIDMSTLPGGGPRADEVATGTSNYASGHYLIFDLHKLIHSWETDPSTSKPYSVKVINYSDYWELEPAIQGLTLDAVTGPTLHTVEEGLSDEITARGSIILKRK
jgi:hypothetical protein